MNNTIVFVFVFIFVFLLSGYSNASPIKISVGEWPPYLSETLDRYGVVARIIQDIFKDEGYKVEFKFLPWPRAYKLAARGHYDATAVWMLKPERLKDFNYSDSLLKENFVFFYLKDLSFDYRDNLDFTDLKFNFGVNIGYSYGEEFNKSVLEKKINIMSKVSTPKQSFSMLLNKRIQVYPQEVNVGYSILKGDFAIELQNKITHHTQPFLINDSFLLFNKKNVRNKVLKEKFNARLKKYKISGRYFKYFINN